MTINSSATLGKYRRAFKKLNVFMLWMWRLGFRKWMNICPPIIGRIMVLTHTGRRTGLPRRTPVNYAIIAGELYCIAGFGSIADWYRNIMRTPRVEIWLPNSWWSAVAGEVPPTDPRRLSILRQVIKDSGFAGLMFGLNAYKLTDEKLDDATRDYCVIHLRRTRRLHGRGGPGDLAWVWLVPFAAVLLWILLQLL